MRKIAIQGVINPFQHSLQLGCKRKLKANYEIEKVGHCFLVHTTDCKGLLIHYDKIIRVVVLRSVGMSLLVAIQPSFASLRRSKLIVEYLKITGFSKSSDVVLLV